MIKEISIKNFKSIDDLSIGLGKVTVLIGENGSGKSNILEAIAMFAAATSDKLDSEFSASRGVRWVEPSLMKCAIKKNGRARGVANKPIKFGAISENNTPFKMEIDWDGERWVAANKGPKAQPSGSDDLEHFKTASKIANELDLENIKVTGKGTDLTLSLETDALSEDADPKLVEWVRYLFGRTISKIITLSFAKLLNLPNFLIFAPENSALRKFEEEGQIQPVGIRGEGLFSMLKDLVKSDQTAVLARLKESLELIGWFANFNISDDLAPGEYKLMIQDKFIGKKTQIDQRSANEGFLFLLFYFAIVMSPKTPAFFAIDNIDATLNPKLCSEMMKRIVALAKTHNKQIILTTHNPAILDGLNLHDPDQKLYTVYRSDQGDTKVRNIPAPKASPTGKAPPKLSEAFMQGLIGGLPNNF